MKNQNIYSYFDDIVCISLDIAPERQKQAHAYFKKLNIPVRFFVVQKHPKGGMYGCFDSHIKILKDAYDRVLDNILVFEDDMIPSDSYSEELVGKAIEFMKSNDDWDIVYFGYAAKFTGLFAESLNKNIMKHNPYMTHALCYSKKAIKKILAHYNTYIGIEHYDVYLADFLQLKTYCILPILFDQNTNLEYYIDGKNIFERILRTLYPLDSYIKARYRMSLIKFYCNIFCYRCHKYNIAILSVIFTIIVLLLIYNKYIYKY